MKYEKPELTCLGSAVATIQASQKAPVAQVDVEHEQTISAYEADE